MINTQDDRMLTSQDQISGDEFTIDMNSIQNTEAGTEEKLVGHLKSADFFNVKNFTD
ncbi:MAG: YceI family protein [Patescibacteria group bacterium]|nr:YceI family protein [Patescibacteria group bacterium]